MPRNTAWTMSEADRFDTLCAIDERLATHDLELRHRDVLVRLPAMLTADLIVNEAESDPRPFAEATHKYGHLVRLSGQNRSTS